MSRNPAGGLHGNGEWGRKHRKEEDDLRGLNNRARREAIQERTRELLDVLMARWGEKVTCPYCQGDWQTVEGGFCGFCIDGIHTLGE